MTAPWATCARCDADLYPRLARRTDEGWACAERVGCGVRRAKAAKARDRIEDIQYMAATGESASGAAARLRIKREALESFCRKHGLRAEWHKLLDREPRDHNVYAPSYERKAS